MLIDETSASTKMARLYGRSKQGTRCRAPVSHGHCETATFTGALSLSRLTAPMVLDGAMMGEWFTAYAQQVLAPTLRPGDVVILDNPPASKGRGRPRSRPDCRRDTAVPVALMVKLSFKNNHWLLCLQNFKVENGLVFCYLDFVGLFSSENQNS